MWLLSTTVVVAWRLERGRSPRAAAAVGWKALCCTVLLELGGRSEVVLRAEVLQAEEDTDHDDHHDQQELLSGRRHPVDWDS